ncbi:MAG TPA: hypothetical protein VFA45_05970 [Actinomycetes bacterium]|nr:hypothetical protein [Actinomycetes bacterium]
MSLVDGAPTKVRDPSWTEVRRLVEQLEPSSYEHRTPPSHAELSAQIGKHLRDAQASSRSPAGERSDPVRLREVPLSHPDAQKLLAWERGELARRHPAERYPGLDARRLQVRDERVDPESPAAGTSAPPTWSRSSTAWFWAVPA